MLAFIEFGWKMIMFYRIIVSSNHKPSFHDHTNNQKEICNALISLTPSTTSLALLQPAPHLILAKFNFNLAPQSKEAKENLKIIEKFNGNTFI